MERFGCQNAVKSGEGQLWAMSWGWWYTRAFKGNVVQSATKLFKCESRNSLRFWGNMLIGFDWQHSPLKKEYFGKCLSIAVKVLMLRKSDLLKKLPLSKVLKLLQKYPPFMKTSSSWRQTSNKHSFFLLTPSLALFTMLDCMTEMVIFALCDSSHFEADTWLVLCPQCMMWTETSTSSFLCFMGFFFSFFGGEGVDLMWDCLLAHFNIPGLIRDFEVLLFDGCKHQNSFYNSLNIVISWYYNTGVSQDR